LILISGPRATWGAWCKESGYRCFSARGSGSKLQKSVAAGAVILLDEAVNEMKQLVILSGKGAPAKHGGGRLATWLAAHSLPQNSAGRCRCR
jgi:hypothetical protein